MQGTLFGNPAPTLYIDYEITQWIVCLIVFFISAISKNLVLNLKGNKEKKDVACYNYSERSNLKVI